MQHQTQKVHPVPGSYGIKLGAIEHTSGHVVVQLLELHPIRIRHFRRLRSDEQPLHVLQDEALQRKREMYAKTMWNVKPVS
eukprot:12924986-Prorocentrum_lima.AAC.1